MRKDEVRQILQKKYCAYRDEVVAIIKSLPPESRQSGDDSGLEDVWEEFKFQVKNEEFVMFDVYVGMIDSFCARVVRKMPTHEQDFLWLDCDAYFDHDDDKGLPDRGELIDGVANELYRKVVELANDEELKFDPDEARQLADFEDDMAPYIASRDERHD